MSQLLIPGMFLIEMSVACSFKHRLEHIGLVCVVCSSFGWLERKLEKQCVVEYLTVS